MCNYLIIFFLFTSLLCVQNKLIVYNQCMFKSSQLFNLIENRQDASDTKQRIRFKTKCHYCFSNKQLSRNISNTGRHNVFKLGSVILRSNNETKRGFENSPKIRERECIHTSYPHSICLPCYIRDKDSVKLQISIKNI